ncbi:MAG: hypothetical protein ACLFUI_03175 [Halanaerobiales bacterium]
MNFTFKNTLVYIAAELNKAGIIWAIGASVLLSFYDLIDDPNDIDILVSLNDVEKAELIMANIGTKKAVKASSMYATKKFHSFKVNDIDVDLIGGFTINFDNAQYYYDFNKKSIREIIKVDGIEIPLTSLEDWFVLYSIMPGREDKIVLLEEYFNLYGITNPDLLLNALKMEIPERIKNRIDQLL